LVLLLIHQLIPVSKIYRDEIYCSTKTKHRLLLLLVLLLIHRLLPVLHNFKNQIYKPVHNSYYHSFIDFYRFFTTSKYKYTNLYTTLLTTGTQQNKTLTTTTGTSKHRLLLVPYSTKQNIKYYSFIDYYRYSTTTQNKYTDQQNKTSTTTITGTTTHTTGTSKHRLLSVPYSTKQNIEYYYSFIDCYRYSTTTQNKYTDQQNKTSTTTITGTTTHSSTTTGNIDYYYWYLTTGTTTHSSTIIHCLLPNQITNILTLTTTTGTTTHTLT
jgi:hypothetical protein